jgi:uncharacterized protein YneF (UPF0154 family)
MIADLIWGVAVGLCFGFALGLWLSDKFLEVKER